MPIPGGQKVLRSTRIAEEAAGTMIVRFYGRLGEALGRQAAIEPPPDGATIADLRHLLAGRYPAAAEDLLSPNVRACVDDRVVGEDHVIKGNSGIEFFPPLSGG